MKYFLVKITVINSNTKKINCLTKFDIFWQQLEEELKRYKQRVDQLEAEVTVATTTQLDKHEHEHQVASLEAENLQLQDKVRELQAQIFALHAKSPEVNGIFMPPKGGI